MSYAYSHILVNLFGVIALILLLMYILKHIKNTKIMANNHIKIINTVSVGIKERIILLEANNKTLLIGATPNHIETLYVFNDDEPIFESEHGEETIESFASQLATLK